MRPPPGWSQQHPNGFSKTTDQHQLVLQRLTQEDKGLGKRWGWYIYENGDGPTEAKKEGTCYSLKCALGCVDRAIQEAEGT